MIERSQVRIPAGAVGEFSSPGSTFCADTYFGICSTPVLPQKHVKDPGHLAKKRRWQVTAKHAYTLRMRLCMVWGCVCVCALMLRIVSRDKILRFKNTFIIIINYCYTQH